VRVWHVRAGIQLEGRPTAEQSVGAVREALLTQLKARFFVPEDFRWEIGRSVYEDGQIGDAYILTHLPSGKWRKTTGREIGALGGMGVVKERWLDEIVEELWQEGYFRRTVEDKPFPGEPYGDPAVPKGAK
jgi:hypothetical protein